MSQIFNIFPTTIYVGEVENHNEYKTEFLNFMINLIMKRMRYLAQ